MMGVRDEGKEVLRMAVRFLMCTVGWMVKPRPGQAPWAGTSLLGEGYKVRFDYVGCECL